MVNKDFWNDTSPCPGCGSTKSLNQLFAEGWKYGCCPDRPGAPSYVDIDPLLIDEELAEDTDAR